MGIRLLRRLNRILWGLAAAAGLYLFVHGYQLWKGDGQNGSLNYFVQEIVYEMQQQTAAGLLPGLAYPLEGRESIGGWEEFLVRRAYGFFPIYGYVDGYIDDTEEYESRSTYEEILRAEAADENTVDAMTGEVQGLTEEEKNMQMENENAAAIALYEQLGFVRLGTVPGGYRRADGRYVDTYVYFHDLRG